MFYRNRKYSPVDLSAFVAVITFAATVIALLILSSTGSQVCAAEPVLFSAQYEVSKGIMSIGHTTRSLEKLEDGNYKFESLSKPGGVAKLFTSGKVRETSIWKWDNANFVPVNYRYKNSSSANRDVILTFDWEKHEVTNSINGDPWTMPIEPGTLDKLLFQMKIMHDLQQGHTTFSYPVADGGKLKTYDISVTGEKIVKMDIGTFNTVVVEYKKNDRTTKMWCAKELNFLPVRIEQQKDDGGSVTADLIKLSGIVIPESAKPKPDKK